MEIGSYPLDSLRHPWPYDEGNRCPTCYSWIPKNSPCDHEKYVCPTCGRAQCLLHWPYPMKTEREALHFLKSAEARTGKECFVRAIQDSAGNVKWKIFTSEADYDSYVATGKHKR